LSVSPHNNKNNINYELIILIIKDSNSPVELGKSKQSPKKFSPDDTIKDADAAPLPLYPATARNITIKL
jgi:hypothetical protein